MDRTFLPNSPIYELLDMTTDVKEIELEVKRLDKLFRNKKGCALRAELYETLRRRYHYSKPITPEDFDILKDYTGVRKSSSLKVLDCLKSPTLQCKKQLQYVVGKMMAFNTNNNSVIHYLCKEKLKYVVKYQEVLEWKVVRMVNPCTDSNLPDDFICMENFEELNHRINHEYRISRRKNWKWICTKVGQSEGFLYLAVRTQVPDAPSRCAVYVISQEINFPHIFYHGRIDHYEMDFMFGMIAKWLNFRGLEKQPLVGKNLFKVIASCKDTVKKPNIFNINKLFEAEEARCGENRMQSLWPDKVKRRMIISSMIADCPNGAGVDKTCVTTRMENNGIVKVHLDTKGANLYEYIAELYNRNFIQDPTPYLLMKASQTNSITLARR